MRLGWLVVPLAALAASSALAAAPASKSKPASWTMDARLAGFECGDDCWLKVKDLRGRADSILCNAPQCEAWMQAGRLPKALAGRKVRMTLRMGKAMSGDVVMAESPQVTRMVFLK